VIAVDVAEGQRHDARLAAPVLAEAKAAVGAVDEVLADKGFDSDASAASSCASWMPCR